MCTTAKYGNLLLKNGIYCRPSIFILATKAHRTYYSISCAPDLEVVTSAGVLFRDSREIKQ